MDEITLTSRTLDAELVEHLAQKYVVEVWEEGEIHYKLTKKKET